MGCPSQSVISLYLYSSLLLILFLSEVSAHEFLSFPRIQFCTERRIQLCAVRKTLRKQLPVLRRLTQIYNMRIQVTMTCGGSPRGRVWEGTSHPGSLREWIPPRVPPGRGCPAAARFFFKQEAQIGKCILDNERNLYFLIINFGVQILFLCSDAV